MTHVEREINDEEHWRAAISDVLSSLAAYGSDLGTMALALEMLAKTVEGTDADPRMPALWKAIGRLAAVVATDLMEVEMGESNG